MDQPRLLQRLERVQQLRDKHFDELDGEPSERVLFDELVQVRRQAFKYEAEMLVVDEGGVHAEDAMFVVRIGFVVELERKCIRGFVSRPVGWAMSNGPR